MAKAVPETLVTVVTVVTVQILAACRNRLVYAAGILKPVEVEILSNYARLRSP